MVSPVLKHFDLSYSRPEALVDASWLTQHFGDPDVVILDASFFLPAANRNPTKEFKASHIPGAVFFDINDVADKKMNLPHMLPSAETFADKAGKLGITESSHVICYDNNGGAMAAMRVFWTFKVFGHEKVSVLNVGFNKWRAQGYSIESGDPKIVPVSYSGSSFNTNLVRTCAQVMDNLNTGSDLIVDARSSGRFNATELEPRAGLRGGHIPGSVNLPFQELLKTDNTMGIKSAKDLEAVITGANLDPSKTIISSCGSGVTAAVLYFALYLLGHDTVSIYDGSWTEWGGRKDTPVAQ